MSIDARLTATIGLALLAVVSLIGCSATPPPQQSQGGMPAPVAPAASTEVAPPTPSITPTPTLKPTTFSGTAHVTDDNGYMMDLSYILTFGPTFTTDTTNDKPGFASILSAGQSSIVLRNTTPDRNYEAPSGYRMVLLYPDTSATCTAMETAVFLMNTNFHSGALQIPGYCDLWVATTDDYTTTQPATFTLETNQATPNIAIRPSGPFIVPGVPEASIEAVKAELPSPSYFLVLYKKENSGFDYQGVFFRTQCEAGPSAIMASQPTYPGC